MAELQLKRAKTKLYLHIANRKQPVLRTMQILSFIVSVITIAAIIIYHGCFLSASAISFIRGLVYFSLAFYIFKYIVLMFYSLHKIEYVKKSWFECIIITVLLLHFILYWFFGWDLFNFKQYEMHIYYVFSCISSSLC